MTHDQGTVSARQTALDFVLSLADWALFSHLSIVGCCRTHTGKGFKKTANGDLRRLGRGLLVTALCGNAMRRRESYAASSSVHITAWVCKMPDGLALALAWVLIVRCFLASSIVTFVQCYDTAEAAYFHMNAVCVLDLFPQ